MDGLFVPQLDRASGSRNCQVQEARGSLRARRRPHGISRLKPMTRKQLAARNKLIELHVHWARGVAMKVSRTLPTWFCYEDLCGPAHVALVEEAELFFRTPSSVPFRAFAYKRVHGACIDAVRRKEYRERAHVSRDAMEESHEAAVLREEAGGREAPECRAEFITDVEDAAIERYDCDRAGLMSGIFNAVWNLPERHQQIIRLRYLYDTPVSEIARRMKLSAPRISQLHAEAIEMLRPAAERMK